MDLHEALRFRRTVHKYTDAPVEAAIVERALEAGRWAPNHKLTNPWRFYLMGEETRARVADVAVAMAEDTARVSGATPARLAQVADSARLKVTGSPVLIAVSSNRVPDDAFREREDYAATSCAIQNMQLSFWADGIGSKWSTGAVTRDARVYSILGVDPARESIVGFVKAGVPQTIPDTKRRPLDEVVVRLP